MSPPLRSKTVKKYLNTYYSLLHQVAIPSRLAQLCQSITVRVPLNPAQAAEPNAIDALRTDTMLRAEHQCCKLKMGRVSLSPTTDFPKHRLVFWSLAIKRRKGGKVSANLWHCKKVQAEITEQVGLLSLQALHEHLNQACNDYRQVKQNHVAKQESFLKSLDTKVSEQLLRVEKQQALGKAAHKVSGKLGGLAVTKVLYDGEECSD